MKPRMGVECYTFADLVALAGIASQTARDWWHRGMYRASVYHGGAGQALAFSFADVFVVWLMANLRRHGISMPTCRRVSAALYESPATDAAPVLVIAGDDVRIVSRTEARKIVRSRATATLVDLARNAARLRREIDVQRAAIAATGRN